MGVVLVRILVFCVLALAQVRYLFTLASFFLMRGMFRRNKKGLIIYRTGFFLKRDVEVVGERTKSVGGYSIEKSTADHDSRDKTWPAL